MCTFGEWQMDKDQRKKVYGDLDSENDTCIVTDRQPGRLTQNVLRTGERK